MSKHRLTTYLRTYRRRTGLSQREVAALLGLVCGTTISRHELGRRVPSLETALAYEAICGVPVRELYAGVFEARAREIERRAHRMLKRGLPDQKRRPRVERALRRMSGAPEKGRRLSRDHGRRP